MPSRVSWIEEPRIMAVDYNGYVTVDDVRQVIWSCVAALHKGPVCFLIDFTESNSLAPEIMELSSLSEWIYHPNARWFAYVKPSRLFQALIVVRQRQSVKFFERRPDAEVFIKEMAKSLA